MSVIVPLFTVTASPALADDMPGPVVTVTDESPSVLQVGESHSLEVKTRFPMSDQTHRYIVGLADDSSPAYTVKTPTCASGEHISGVVSGMQCSYTIPAGMAVELEQSFPVQAQDTGVLTVDVQPKIIVTEDNQLVQSATIGGLTVEGVPYADLTLDNRNQKGVEQVLDWNADHDLTGYLTISPKPLRQENRTDTIGALAQGLWTVKLDVHHLPKDTVWTFDGDKLTVDDQGMLTLTGKQGEQRVDYRIPAHDVADMQEQETRSWDVRMIPDKTSFSVKDKNDHDVLNMGVGGEPGWNTDRDDTTEDDQLGSEAGYPYVNNDWSRIIVHRQGENTLQEESEEPQVESTLTISRPTIRQNATYFDLTDPAMDKMNTITHVNGDDQLAAGTPFTVEFNASPANQPTLKLPVGLVALTEYSNDIEWSVDGKTWADGTPSDTESNAIQFIRPKTDAKPPLTIPMKVSTDLTADQKATFTLTAKDKTIPEYVNLLTVKPVEQSFHVQTDTTTVTSGGQISVTANMSLRNVQHLTSINPTITVNHPEHMTLDNKSTDDWTTGVQNDTISFTLKNPNTTQINLTGTITFPTLSLTIKTDKTLSNPTTLTFNQQTQLNNQTLSPTSQNITITPTPIPTRKQAVKQKTRSLAPQSDDTTPAIRGAIAYFTAKGADDAVKILTDSTYTMYLDSIHDGFKGDAATIKNMIDSVKQIKIGNGIRQARGLEPYKITDTLMAQAIADTDYSNNVEDQSGQYNSSENVAWGWGLEPYSIGSGADNPYTGWYDDEKKNYDRDMEDGKLDGKDANGNPSGKWGHYRTLIYEEWNTTTGYGISQNQTLQYGNGSTQCQVFNDDGDSYTDINYTVQYTTGRIMDADEYLTDLTEYEKTLPPEEALIQTDVNLPETGEYGLAMVGGLILLIVVAGGRKIWKLICLARSLQTK
ncbi:hypothetical protein [Bifidobacterium sp. SO1]|uniref:hypothetical protein n=1 Tax=Bifidobacterium sp. SO1 TaxID=2809029 RepID=UPI001BDCF509|nr:hypothetical protein [Bifidobacterium sp. SO1]MBT1162539.1 CAP domain-containing protein [Bifidobacterium sp. SO1]